MKIYQLEYRSDYIDAIHDNTILCTIHPHEISQKVTEKIEDEDFSPDGFKNNDCIFLYVWENGVCQKLWTFYPTNKIKSMDFLDIFLK